MSIDNGKTGYEIGSNYCGMSSGDLMLSFGATTTRLAR